MDRSPQPDKSAPQPDGALEQFEILGKIAEGGMGAVYKARHTGLDKLVALKVLNTRWKDDTALLRFQNEAKTLSRLNHPYIAGVYDFGISKNGEPFMAIEFVEGITLQDLILSRQKLPLEDAIPLWLEICTALSHAHNRGVVHRDVKPSNVMLTIGDDGERTVKVVDFGIAKSFDSDTGSLTQTGGMIGSPLFMSPEQSLGQSPTPQSDMYSLGCVMFYCLAGRPPFEGDTILDTVIMHRENPPPSLEKLLPNIPERVALLVNKLLNKNKEKRPESMDSVIRELEGIFEETFGEPATVLDEKQVAPVASLKEITSIHEKEKISKLPIIVMCAVGLMLSVGIVAAIILNLQSKSSKEVIKTSDVGDTVLAKDDKSLIDPVDDVRRMLESGKSDYILNADYQKEGWQWTDDNMAVFDGAKKVVQSVDLTNNTKFTDAGLKHLNGQPLQTLKLNETAVKDLQYLPHSCHETLRHLELERTAITDKALQKLEEYTNLTRLHLDSTRVSADAIKRLLDKVELTELRMDLDPVPPKTVFEQLYQKYPNCHFSPGKQGSMLEKDTRVSMRHLQDGNAPAALEVWKSWEGKLDQIRDPKKRIASKVYQMEAMCFASMDKFKPAEQVLRKAVALSEKYGSTRDQISAYTQLFQLCIKTKQIPESIKVGRKLLAMQKSDNKIMTLETGHVQNQLAELLMLTGQFKEASGLIAETIDELKVAASVQTLTEERARSEKRWQPKDKEVTETIQDTWATAYLRLAQCQMQLQQNSDAHASLLESIKILQPMTLRPAKRSLMTAYSLMAQLCVNTQKLEEALDYSTQSVQIAQAIELNKNGQTLLLEQQRNILNALGRTEQAKKLADRIAAVNAKQKIEKAAPKQNH